ncbi:hypothetical protein A3G50_00630 [Candidatus Jorgensenbacteria bacterium RIFCSPLOWO2_12_FULL_42_11]|uniref:SGNH hydrolase-type esterase domain-containing protein n=1 Tax=Candidatus Jorgensenbacteria bacterium RIFCSPLOWO2_12_FULL_42_11 TaxID=1798473 RepID=A0A1F6C1H6_9BACT|nr:MAG: hypothetical protein A3G50_00630 [Candidatus Jorgensenbacteria bacterium RIFCSPLOWO2_12_FULL_42_11]
MAQILVFGDSIAYGAWDKEGGWVSRLRKFIDEKNLTDPDFECLIYNLGVSGDTTEDLLERFEFELEQRLDEEMETILIFSIGVNDSQFVKSKYSIKIPQEKFRANLEELITAAKKYSSKIIFVGLWPVNEEKTNPVSWDEDKFYKNDSIRNYSNVIKTICEKNQVHFIDLFGLLLKEDYKKLLEDGLHPNSQGHQKFFEIIRDFLAENKIV